MSNLTDDDLEMVWRICEERNRKVAGELLLHLAGALYLAALVLLFLMLLLWGETADQTGFADFPGRYCLALFPVLVVAVTLHVGSERIRDLPWTATPRPAPRPHEKGDDADEPEQSDQPR